MLLLVQTSRSVAAGRRAGKITPRQSKVSRRSPRCQVARSSLTSLHLKVARQTGEQQEVPHRGEIPVATSIRRDVVITIRSRQDSRTAGREQNVELRTTNSQDGGNEPDARQTREESLTVQSDGSNDSVWASHWATLPESTKREGEMRCA